MKWIVKKVDIAPETVVLFNVIEPVSIYFLPLFQAFQNFNKHILHWTIKNTPEKSKTAWSTSQASSLNYTSKTCDYIYR